MIPDDGREPEHLLCNGPDAQIRVTVRRPPVLRDTPARRVVDKLYRPSDLGEDLDIRLGGHVWVGPSMNGDIILVRLEGGFELLRIQENVGADEEVRHMFRVASEELIQLIGRLDARRISYCLSNAFP